MTRCAYRQRLLLAANLLLLASTWYVTPVAAQSASSNTDPCTGMGPGETWICNGIMGIADWIVDGLEAIVFGLFEAVVNIIVDTPAPYHSGERAFFERPDNPPWPALYDLYWTWMLPIGIGLWALIVLIVKLTRLFTHTAGGEYQRIRLERRAAFGLLVLIAWWPMGAFTLHLADGLTGTIAPTGAQMVGTFSEFMANVTGGLLAAVILYLSSGVVAFLLLLLFLARMVAIFTLMPLMPILLTLWIVDEGPMAPVARLAESIGGLFVPFVFMTVPTAAILLVGYTIQDSLRVWLSSIPALGVGGASNPSTSVYAMILFVFWVMALAAPVLVLLGSRGAMPFVYMGAGLLGGASIGRAWGTRSGTASVAGTRGGAGGSSSTGAAGAAATESYALQPYQTEALARVGRSSVGGATNGSHRPSGDGSNSPRSVVRSDSGGGLSGAYPIRERISTWKELSERLPEDRRYEFGYSINGEFQSIDAGPPNSNKESILSKKFRRVTKSRKFQNENDMYLRDSNGQYYDVTNLKHLVDVEDKFESDSREVVTSAMKYRQTGDGGQNNLIK